MVDSRFVRVFRKGAVLIGQYLCKYRGLRFFDGLSVVSRAFYRAINNVNFDINSNGEKRVLCLLQRFNPTCIFDVGANIGEWTLLAHELFPRSVIHCFEIVPTTFSILIENVTKFDRVIANNVGLSNSVGEIDIYLSLHESTTATAYKLNGMSFHDSYYGDRVKCSTITGTDYIIKNKINEIDLLKIDVEGMDLKVIKGFGDLISRVKVIQFEYGVFNIQSHDLLWDFYKYLTSHGFVIGKIYPRHVQFMSEYSFDMENFHGNNYLAVRSCESDLINLLASRAAY